MSARYRLDGAVALAGASFGAVAAALAGAGPGVCVAAVAVGASLGVGRHYARPVWILTTAAVLAGAVTETTIVWPYLLVGAVAFCAGRWDGRWSGVVGLAALTVSLELNAATIHDAAVPFLLLVGAPWAAGRALREREQVADQLAQRARELEQERDAHAALSVRYERARIASELHDIVAHAISVMVVQASAGQRLAARDPEATAETFEAIAGAARQAEQDMGRLVALLGDEKAIGQAPDRALVEELVARAAGSGLDVTLRLEGEREGLPAPLGETAYHVVQEGLTNVLRYSAGAAARVRVRGDHETLLVEVINAPARTETALAGAGTGTGLRGLRERVGASGGALEAGPTSDGGWRLSARLPRRVTTPTN